MPLSPGPLAVPASPVAHGAPSPIAGASSVAVAAAGLSAEAAPQSVPISEPAARMLEAAMEGPAPESPGTPGLKAISNETPASAAVLKTVRVSRVVVACRV
jgi:hypothetical protein